MYVCNMKSWQIQKIVQIDQTKSNLFNTITISKRLFENAGLIFNTESSKPRDEHDIDQIWIFVTCISKLCKNNGMHSLL